MRCTCSRAAWPGWALTPWLLPPGHPRSHSAFADPLVTLSRPGAERVPEAGAGVVPVHELAAVELGRGREGEGGARAPLLRRPSLCCCFFFPLSFLSLFLAAAEGPGRAPGRGGGTGAEARAEGSAERRRGKGVPPEGKRGRRDPAVSAFAPAPCVREKGGARSGRGRPGGPVGAGSGAPPPPLPPPPPPPLRSRCSHLCTRRLGEGEGKGGGAAGCLAAPASPLPQSRANAKKKREREGRHRAPAGLGV